MLAAGLLISLSLGMFVTLLFRQLGPELPVDRERFFDFLISSASFQGAGLLMIHFFLKQHEMTWREFLGLRGPRLSRAVLMGLGVVAVALPLIMGFNEVMRSLITRLHSEPETQPTMQILEISVSLGQRILFGFTAIVVAPVVEETLFRGIIYRAIQQRGYPGIALFGSSLLFGIIHGSMMTLLPLTALAIILALLYDRAGNLMAPIVAHSFFNTVNFFGYLYRQEIEHWWKQFRALVEAVLT
jgi:membrane protease YdiL (CAAX protease family)